MVDLITMFILSFKVSINQTVLPKLVKGVEMLNIQTKLIQMYLIVS